ncbi:MAG: hypothetical protein HY721_04505 [Planctomycetes bacterium]|nr:hypothetical protein [Planctomycetota bacterium]
MLALWGCKDGDGRGGRGKAKGDEGPIESLEGSYSGSTSQGKSLGFKITGMRVVSYVLWYEVPPCFYGDAITVGSADAPVVDGRFEISSFDVKIRGTVTRDGSASGLAEVTYRGIFPNTCTSTAFLTWKAVKTSSMKSLQARDGVSAQGREPSLRLISEKEPNDLWAQAQVLGSIRAGCVLHVDGALLPRDEGGRDADRYRVAVNGGETLELRLASPEAAHFDLEILDTGTGRMLAACAGVQPEEACKLTIGKFSVLDILVMPMEDVGFYHLEISYTGD